MIPPRLIPVLLVDRHRRVVKSVRFGNRTYIGDPFNILRLFNEKQVDEICVLDIDATIDGRPPDFGFAKALAAECFMPLSFGGGISEIGHARKLISFGVEKVVLRTHAKENLIAAIAQEFGVQAIIGCIDYRDANGQRIAVPNHAPLVQQAAALARAGAGEIILQSIDRDGTRAGMDLKAVSDVAPNISAPVIALGGAGTTDHLIQAIAAGADAAASGSAFTFIGRLRAVLITYPDFAERLKSLHA